MTRALLAGESSLGFCGVRASYAAVPITTPVRVIDADPAACAIPKSVILTVPSRHTSRFAGLTSP